MSKARQERRRALLLAGSACLPGGRLVAGLGGLLLVVPPVGAAGAPRVALVGQIGNKALLAIGSSQPRAFAIGQSQGPVRLVAFDGSEALVEIDGVRYTLHLGEPWTGPSSGSGPAEVVLKVGTNGHFHAEARINGTPLPVIVDTGASFVAVPVAEARRIGLPYADGARVALSTANGNTWGYKIRIDTVSVGNISLHGIDAVVQETLPFTLLGMSFLSRMTMRRDGDTMTLTRRF